MPDLYYASYEDRVLRIPGVIYICKLRCITEYFLLCAGLGEYTRADNNNVLVEMNSMRRIHISLFLLLITITVAIPRRPLLRPMLQCGTVITRPQRNPWSIIRYSHLGSFLLFSFCSPVPIFFFFFSFSPFFTSSSSSFFHSSSGSSSQAISRLLAHPSPPSVCFFVLSPGLLVPVVAFFGSVLSGPGPATRSEHFFFQSFVDAPSNRRVLILCILPIRSFI